MYLPHYRTARSNVLAKCEKRSPSDRNGVSVVKKQRIVSRDEGKTAEVLMPLRDISNTDPSPASCLDKPKAGLSQGSEGSKRSVTLIDWNCDLCTYLNSKRAIKCQMCGFKVKMTYSNAYIMRIICLVFVFSLPEIELRPNIRLT